MLATVSAKVATASATIILSWLSRLPFLFLNLFFYAYLIFLWLFLVRWIGSDAARRGLSKKSIRLFQAAVLVFSLPGLLAYLLLRPATTLGEKERAEMEEELLKLELEKLRRELKSN